MKQLIALIAGVLFGTGLIVSGMTNPMKVVNFLDVFGAWDPSLALVMASALAVTFLGYRFVLRRPAPAYGNEFHMPTKTEITWPLIFGSILFGVGWGLAGLCPGPAISVAPMAPLRLLPFAVGLVVGMWVFQSMPEGHRTARPQGT